MLCLLLIGNIEVRIRFMVFTSNCCRLFHGLDQIILVIVSNSISLLNILFKANC